MVKKKKVVRETPRVHEELEGFDIKINSFGEIITNYSIDKINEFLNRNVKDKKFKDREEFNDSHADNFKETTPKKDVDPED